MGCFCSCYERSHSIDYSYNDLSFSKTKFERNENNEFYFIRTIPIYEESKMLSDSSYYKSKSRIFIFAEKKKNINIVEMSDKILINKL